MKNLLNKRILLSIIICVIVPIIGAVLCSYLFGNKKFPEEPFHSTIESAGAFVSLIAVLLLIQIRKYWIEPDDRMEWVMCALIAMGIFDLAHSFVYSSNNNFAWFHGLASISGGLFFACVWFPLKNFKRLYVYTFILVTLVVIFYLIFPNYAPSLIIGDQFKPASRIMNFLGGVFFIVGSIYFLKKYSLEKGGYNYLLACHGLLFGSANLLFDFARLWDSIWWFWHFLRLFGYSIIFIYFYQVLELLGMQLAEKKVEAERSNIAKSKFLSNISHELRTPMNSIIGLSDSILESKLDKKQEKNMKIIQKAGESLLEIINNVLNLSKIESGKMSLEKSVFDLKEFVYDIEMVLSQSAKVKGLKLKVNYLIKSKFLVIGDHFKLKQILTNLINNGIKFTKKGSVTIQVSNSIVSEKSAEILFEIIDTGEGIKESSLVNIFDRFHQQNVYATKEIGGAGLGLSISQEFANLMDSEIKVKSEIGKGSIFYFKVILPIGKKPKSDEKEIEFVDFNPSNIVKMLVVDDFKENRVIMDYYLKHELIETTLCEDGLEALQLFKTNTYDLVIMDIFMPVMDGIESAIEMRKFESENNRKQTILIALSAIAFEEDKQNSLNAGFNYHLEKPIRKKEFLSFLQEIHMAELDQ